MKTPNLCGLVCLTFAAFSVCADSPTPGMYAVEVQVENPALGLSQSQESTECITTGDFENGQRAFLDAQQQLNQCELGEYEMDGGVISMSMSCIVLGGGETTIDGQGTYTSTSFTFTNKMSMEVAGTKMAMQTVANGTWIGDC